MSLARMFMAAAAAAAANNAVTVDLPAALNGNSVVITPSEASASIGVQRDGQCFYIDSGLNYVDWATPRSSTVGDDFEVKYDVLTGSTPSGSATGTWLPLTSDRTWTLTQAGIGSNSGTGTISIRRASGGGTLDTCSASLFASVESGD